MAEILENVKIHDAGKLEIKQIFPFDDAVESPEYTAEMYFFLPQSLNVNAASYSKEHFYRDMQSHIRYQTPSFRLRDLVNSPDSVFREIESLLKNPGYDGKTFLYLLKLCAAEVKSTLRDEAARMRRQYQEHPEEISAFEENTQILLARFRGLRKLLEAGSGSPENVEFFNYADEYISLLAEYYLTRTAMMLPAGDAVSQKLYAAMIKIATQEESYREKCNYPSVIREESSNEDAVYRMRALKKVMSSALYLHVFRNVDGRFTDQLVIAIAAGLAMLIAGIPAMFGRQLFSDITLGFIVMAVIFYMVKDRVKELSRMFFLNITRRFFSDYRTRIVDDDGNPVGVSKELFSFVAEDKVPEKIVSLRDRPRLVSEVNRFGGESILYYKKHIRLFRNGGNARFARFNGVVDVMRFNIRPLLEHVDNAEKHLILPQGDRVKSISGHTVYHVNMILRCRSSVVDEAKKYRIVADRNGIVRIEDK